jgi:hypothetical protein
MNDTTGKTGGEMKQIAVKDMDAGEIRKELAQNKVTLHHKTGIEKLISTLIAVRTGNYQAPAPTESAPKAPSSIPKPVPEKFVKPTAAALAAKKEHETLTREQRAMKLTRVIVTPNDPNMSSYPGLIFTVGSSKVNNGRMIKKFVPFNKESGWHVPQIILDTIENAEMQKFKTVKLPDGNKTSQAYITKKFNVQVLDPLTNEEMQALAASQRAVGGLG